MLTEGEGIDVWLGTRPHNLGFRYETECNKWMLIALEKASEQNLLCLHSDKYPFIRLEGRGFRYPASPQRNALNPLSALLRGSGRRRSRPSNSSHPPRTQLSAPAR